MIKFEELLDELLLKSNHHQISFNKFLIKTTATRNEIALSYHRVRGLYFLAVVFVATID